MTFSGMSPELALYLMLRIVVDRVIHTVLLCHEYVSNEGNASDPCIQTCFPLVHYLG